VSPLGWRALFAGGPGVGRRHARDYVEGMRRMLQQPDSMT
jgi:hypothetical protein